MIRTVRRIQLITPTVVGLLLTTTVLVTVAAVGAQRSTYKVLPGALACAAVSGATAGSLDAAQEHNARIIVSVALSRSLGATGAAIGVAVALAESTLYNYANDGTSSMVGAAEGRQLNDAERAVARESVQYPHDRVGNNLDSMGLFQQRPMTGWGTTAQLMDPATATGFFYDRLERVPGWQALPPWIAAQTVQGSSSSDGGIYLNTYGPAVSIVGDLTGISASGSSAAATASSPQISIDDQWCASPAGAVQNGPASAAWGGYANGRIPASALCPIPSAPQLLLECHAAAAFDELNTSFKAVFGQDIGITDGYRSYEEQVACRAQKGSLCADPGTSNHGWGKAVDVGGCCGINSGSGPAFDWLSVNAGRFGWVHPAWAKPGGSNPEPWHWEFGSIS